MNSAPRYSVIVPVYNRPEELNELLSSLVVQTFQDFEVIVVEDGSTQSSESICLKYNPQLSIQYFSKPNSGPGPSRNAGFEKAKGEYFVVFDSDCILPSHYFDAIEKFRSSKPVDAWGGPDRGHENFTPLQRAMAYTMSSILTTGGIRGGGNQANRFQPRSFNMGFSRKVWEQTKGFSFDRLAEDIELSIRIRSLGFSVALIPEAFVYHKRRTSLIQFFKQVDGFGRGRVRVAKVHPGEVKITHWFPSLFLLGIMVTPFIFLIDTMPGLLATALIGVYLLGILIDAIRVTHSLLIALLSVPSAVVQLTGYGYGFLMEKLKS